MKKFFRFILFKLSYWRESLREALSEIIWCFQIALGMEMKPTNPEHDMPLKVSVKKKIAISSGHGLHVRGAKGIIDEVDEARRVTDRVAKILTDRGHECVVFHDDVSCNADDNLNAIIGWHRAQDRDRDVFIHFNAFDAPTAHGTEAIFRDVCDKPFAARVAESMSKVGFRLRPAQNGSTMLGATKRSDLRVLNSLTDREEVLIEVCFVTSPRDVQIYNENFESLCGHIAAALAD